MAICLNTAVKPKPNVGVIKEFFGFPASTLSSLSFKLGMKPNKMLLFGAKVYLIEGPVQFIYPP